MVLGRVEARFDRKQLDKALKRAPRRLTEALGLAFQKHGQDFRSSMLTVFGPNAGQLRVRTGALRRSLGYIVTGQQGKSPDAVRLRVFVGGGLPYARIQEEGGIVTPKKGEYLTIPLPTIKTRAGVNKVGSLRDLMDAKKAYIAKSKKGNLLAFATKLFEGKKAGTPLFVLKRSVRIPPRLSFAKTFNSNAMRGNRNFWINKATAAALRKL